MPFNLNCFPSISLPKRFGWSFRRNVQKDFKDFQIKTELNSWVSGNAEQNRQKSLLRRIIHVRWNNAVKVVHLKWKWKFLLLILERNLIIYTVNILSSMVISQLSKKEAEVICQLVTWDYWCWWIFE